MQKIRVNKSFLSILLFVFVLAAVLRFVGIYPGYPPDHPDEPVLTVAYDMWKYKLFDPSIFSAYRFQYPGFLPYVSMFIMAGFFIPVTSLVHFMIHPTSLLYALLHAQMSVLDTISGIREVNPLFWSRFLSAGLSFFSIPLVYLIGETLFSPSVGLIASILTAVNYRHIISSHLSLPDGPNSTFALVSFYLSFLLLQRAKWRRYIAAAIGVGLSLATKLHIYSLIIFIFAHFFASFKQKSLQSWVWFLVSRSVVAALIAIGIFFLFNPFLLKHLYQALEIQRINSLRYGFGAYFLSRYSLWYLFTIGYGIFPSVLFIFGAFIIFVTKKFWLQGLFLALAIVFPMWMLAYYSHGGVYTRNFTSIVPFMTLISGVGLWYCIHGISKKPFWILFFALAVSVTQLKNSFVFDFFLSKPWNQNCFIPLLSQIIQPGDLVSSTGAIPRPPNDVATYVPQSNNYGRRYPYSLREMQESNISYYAINYNEAWGYFYSTVLSEISWVGLPLNSLDNQFEGLALKELSRYVIATCYKPWQSLDNNYAIIKIPKERMPTELTQLFASSINKTILNTGSKPSPVRVPLSEPMVVNGGKVYVIRSNIRPLQPIEELKREGFLRIDFYRDFASAKEGQRGILSAVSSRIFGTQGIEKQIIQPLPPDAHYMTVSFQDDDRYADFYIGNLSVYTSNEQLTQEEQKMLNTKEVDDSIVYPKFIF